MTIKETIMARMEAASAKGPEAVPVDARPLLPKVRTWLANRASVSSLRGTADATKVALTEARKTLKHQLEDAPDEDVAAALQAVVDLSAQYRLQWAQYTAAAAEAEKAMADLETGIVALVDVAAPPPPPPPQDPPLDTPPLVEEAV